MSDVLEYKKIQIRNEDLFETSCNLMEEEGFEVHQKPTFIAFVQKETDSRGLRPKIIFSAKDNKPHRGHMGTNYYYGPVVFNDNVESIIDDITENLGMGSTQSDEYESNIVKDKEVNYSESDDIQSHNYLNNDFSEALDMARKFESAIEANETEKKVVMESKRTKEIKETKNNNENEWISVNAKLPPEDEIVEVAYSYDIYNQNSPYVKPLSKIGYKIAFLKGGEWYEENENYVGKPNLLDRYDILAWKNHIPYQPQTIEDFFDKSNETKNDYDFVCIKDSKNIVLGTMIIKNGRPVVQTVKGRNSFSLDDVVIDFEEWFQKDVGIDNGLTITVMR